MFNRLAPFIQNYIYQNNWEELRDIQVKACEVIFDTNDNLLLATGTASGKTEAAFLPALTVIQNDNDISVEILYISPLKALINDQFERLDDLLLESNIPVFKWHGDVAASKKKKLIKSPKGILQITPESLQSIVMNSPELIHRLFNKLKFVIIDEVHYFMNIDRGLQLLCLLEQIQRVTDNIPRRIGLSATLGDFSSAETWINSGTGRVCHTPIATESNRMIRLSVRHYRTTEKDYEETIATLYKEMYKETRNQKCIIYSPSRDAVEATISKLKEISINSNESNNYLVHHGSISAKLREYAERTMKNAEDAVTIGATLTLELGIDIGSLDKVISNGPPITVSSFVQRLGRTGRRDKPGTMLFNHIHVMNPKKMNYSDFDWGLLKTIAAIELYTKEKWVESPKTSKKNFSMLYHQTLCYLRRVGDASPKQVAQEMLTLDVFKYVTQDEYKLLLRYMIDLNHIELTEKGQVIIGFAAERMVNHYSFLAVFEASEEYKVFYRKQLIGTIDQLLPIDSTFNIAGSTWRVLDINEKGKSMYVTPVDDDFKTYWNRPTLQIADNKVVEQIYTILNSSEKIKYLDEGTNHYIDYLRNHSLIKESLNSIVVEDTDNQFRIHTWKGTLELCTLAQILKTKGIDCSIKNSNVPLYIEVKNCNMTCEELKSTLNIIFDSDIVRDELVIEQKDLILSWKKFSEYVPDELLTSEYKEDYIVDLNIK